MNPRFLEPGTRLSRYVIRERLGRGAAATVYLAEDSSSGVLVALKTLHDPTGSPAADRLKREIALARRIAHPGVCNVFEIQEQDEIIFLTLEYIPGRTLEAAIEQETKLAPPRAARVMGSVCAALNEAHELDILHRDLKPGNIMLRPDDTPAILDFGYATGPDVARLTQTGVWVGTLQYLAPEILKNQSASKSSDIYSLGVTLYRTLTGEYPFPGITFGEIASAVLFHDPTPPNEYVPDLDPGLQTIVLKAMARERRERYLHVGELGNDLSRLNLGEDVTDPRFALPEVIAGEKSLPHALVLAIEASTTQKEAMLATVLVAEPSSLEGKPLTPESTAGRRWLMLRYDLLHPEVEKWQGTTLGARSEELMAWFATADDAVRAALGMQRLLEPEGVAADGPDQGVALRIGIQTGYAQFNRGRLTGDAAAAAGRIARSAAVDHIVVTGTTRASLSDHLKPLAGRLEPKHPAPVAEVLYRIESDASARTSVMLKPMATAPMPMSDEAPPDPARRPVPQPMSVEMTPSQEGIAELVQSATAAPLDHAIPPPKKPKRKPKPKKPKPEKPKPEKQPEKPKPVLDLATLRKEHAELVQSLRDAREQRGIVVGDNATLDGLERTAELELSRGAWDAGVECLQLALKEIGDITIDNKFVALKLQRLHVRMREKGVRRDEGNYEPLLAEIMNAFKSHEFEAANASLNRAFELLA